MVETVGTVAAALQFLGAAQTCLSAFQEIRQNTPEVHRVLNLRLEAEALKFREWCEYLDVPKMLTTAAMYPDGWDDSDEMKNFRERLRRSLRFDNERVAKLTITSIQDMELIFRKAKDKLISVAGNIDDPSSISLKPPGKHEWVFKGIFQSRKSKLDRPGRISSTGRRSLSSLDLRSRASSIYVSVKWVALDKKSFTSMLDNITSINNCLNTFLSDEGKIIIQRRVQASLLRNHQPAALSADDALPGFREIQTLAAIKEEVQREKEDEEQFDQSQTTSAQARTQWPPSTQPNTFEVSDFTTGTLDVGPPRTVSLLTGRPVLIEWTYYGKSIKQDHFYRRGHLLRLLNDFNVFRKFNTLPSRGVVIDSKNSRIGLVFQAPNGLRGRVRERTLLELLDCTARTIGQRFSLAKVLSTAVHNLQSVGWLHKSIRCDNIVFFESETLNGVEISVPPDTGNIEDMRSNRWRTLPIIPEMPEFYLLGWNLSRPDSPGDLSHSISTQGYKLTQEMIRLSSHPDLLPMDGTTKRPRFKLEHDIYSLGLVLLEIGLWKSLVSLRARCSTDEQFREKTEGVYCDMLLSNMGEVYWRATKRCLHMDFGIDSTSSSSTQGFYDGGLLSVAFERDVVSKLEACNA